MERPFFTLEEILPAAGESLPASMAGLADHARREGWRNNPALHRIRFGKGGGYEYHASLLPASVLSRVMIGRGAELSPDSPASPPNALWEAFEAASSLEKQRARERLDAVNAVLLLQVISWFSRTDAVNATAFSRKISTSALWRWLAKADQAVRADRLAALLERQGGGARQSLCDPRAWDFIAADYLRPESARFAACYRRLLRAAAANSWLPIPSQKTLQRRLEREFPAVARTIARKGRDAAKRMYPGQTRERSHFGPLQAMNADGHIGDNFVTFEDGEIGRPALVVFQDIFSGTILAHRIDRTFNSELVRLTFSDVCARWAVPEKLWLDNGREFASKWLTGRMKHRFRFTIKEDEPKGIFTALVPEVHWTTPYHGQAKPIERAFRDLAEDLAKHPRLAGSYTGANPLAKPDNYRAKAIPIADYAAIAAAEIEAHNQRQGRRGRGMEGRSFLERLNQALESAVLPPRRASAEQRRMLLMAAEGVTARAPTGEVHLMGNRYWAEPLADRIGQKLVIRFDPQNLKAGVAVYSIDGCFITEAESIEASGFDDVTAAREHNRRRNDYLKAGKALLTAERRLTIAEVAALLPDAPPAEAASPRVVRLVANGAALQSIQDTQSFGEGIAALDAGAVLPFRRA